ncbi:hypothetical protein [Melittangium boletus]|uniref:Uncharacterized protein n=1 Tax=Melittangium boletus DSM 14713 TaxID=1294270 RepID=A0A250IDV7_9BACT|nr:hypothetical protein [Melittangium boletus]ATB29423.1 hypothetical protein MEBOL_002872 [Melittangium boletus DSM 14713]
MLDPIRSHPSSPVRLVAAARPSAASGSPSSESRPLPYFLSSEPPRSEGEALLRRIFSRGAQV